MTSSATPGAMRSSIAPAGARSKPNFGGGGAPTSRGRSSPFRSVCPYDPCPVVLGTELIWRNRSHLTATIARRLAPSMRVLVEDALAAGPSAR